MPRRASWAAVIAVTMAMVYARSVSAQTLDPSFEADIKALMDATGAVALGTQMASLISGQIIDAMQKAQPNMPERAFALAKEVLDAEFAKAFAAPDGLIASLIPIYARHFTPDEVRGLLAFYRTDLGKKTVTTMPTLMQEGAAAGQTWMMANIGRITAVLQERLKAEGLIK